MKTSEHTLPTRPPNGPVIGRPELERELQLVVLYEDRLTERWTWAVDRAISSATPGEAVSRASWELSGLASSEVLADAVKAAAYADVIVLSVHAGEELPLECYVWVDAWLPRRLQVKGALIALIAGSERALTQSDQVQQYLRAVARRANLDFYLEWVEHYRSPAHLSFRESPVEMPAKPDERNGHRHPDHWGLNE